MSNYVKIWVRIYDGKNVAAVRTKKQVIQRIREIEDCCKADAESKLENGETDWQEIFLE